MEHDFRGRLRRGERLIGTMVTLPSPEVTEVLASIGFDWLFLDAEHGVLGARDLQALLQAAGRAMPGVVRVAAAAEVPIKKALDIGAAGIIVPQVNSAAQAAEVVRLARYTAGYAGRRDRARAWLRTAASGVSDQRQRPGRRDCADRTYRRGNPDRGDCGRGRDRCRAGWPLRSLGQPGAAGRGGTSGCAGGHRLRHARVPRRWRPAWHLRGLGCRPPTIPGAGLHAAGRGRGYPAAWPGRAGHPD